MLVKKDFKFTINVSTGQYPTKKPEKAWAVQYAPQTLTISDIETLQKEGKAFCYNFKDVDESGLVTVHQKTLNGFDYTNVIFYDIDKMPCPMEDYISGITFKPSLAYTTISNGKEGRYGYRLLYALEEPLRSIEQFDDIYYAIAAANGFQQRVYEDGTKYEFDYRKVNQQYYGGGYQSETYRTDLVYSVSEFTSFIEDGYGLKEQIKPAKKKTTKKEEVFPFENNIDKEEEEEEQAYYSELENPFFEDLFSMSPKDFLIKYDREGLELYDAAVATTLTLSEDGKYWIYPDDYQEVKRNWGVNSDGRRCVRKWAIGSGRKKRLYVTAQIMKHNVPDITNEELIYCLVRERYYYYVNTDNKLNNKVLIQIADSALSREFTLSPCKHCSFSINKDYWLRKNITGNVAKNLVKKEIKETEVMALYDFNLTVKENLNMLKENGIKIGKSTLYKLTKKYSDDKGSFPFENNIGKHKKEPTYYSEMESVLKPQQVSEQPFLS